MVVVLIDFADNRGIVVALFGRTTQWRIQDLAAQNEIGNGKPQNFMLC